MKRDTDWCALLCLLCAVYRDRSIVKKVLHDRDAVRRTLKPGNGGDKCAGDW